MAAEPAPAFQFYVKDWRSSRRVQAMSFDERGRYLEMLIEQWETGSLPATPAELATLLGGTEAGWKRAWLHLSQCFAKRPRDGRLINQKLEAVRRERLAFKKSLSESGLRGATKRWNKHRVAIASLSEANGVSMASDASSTATATSSASSSASSTATATAPSSSSLGSRNGNKGSAEAFIVEFQRLYSRHRSNATYYEHRHDRALVEELLTHYSFEHLSEMAVVLLTLDASSDKWVAEGDRSLRVLKHRSTLLDDRVRQRGSSSRIASGRNCSHDPRCRSYQQCTERTLSENREQEARP